MDNTSSEHNKQRYEQYLQQAFEMIAKAFDSHVGNYENKINELTIHNEQLVRDNQTLRKEKEYCLKEIQSLKTLNQQLMQRLDNNNNNQRRMCSPCSGNMNYIGVNTEHMVNDSDDNYNNVVHHNINQSKSDVITTRSIDHEYIINNYKERRTRNKHKYNNQLLTLNSNDDNDNENRIHNKTNSTKNKTVFLFQRKYSETSPSVQQQHYPPNRLIKYNNNVNRSNNHFNNESLFSSSKEENAFLKRCKDNLSPQLFDKILTTINNYNNGEVSYNETVFQIKQLFQSNQDFIISCNKLFK